MFRAALFVLIVALSPQARAAAVEVDLELVLAVDVSRSMSPDELELQRRGYAEALSSPAVAAAIARGLLGRIAVTYIEWAGDGVARTVAPWTLIETAGDAAAFAARLTARFDPALKRTSISSGVDHAARALRENRFEGLRRVIDVSGDGPNNQGRPVEAARDAAIAEGITINGLPLMTKDGDDGWWSIDRLDQYYEACVIGGPGAFVVPVLNWSQFPEAVRRKIVLEIAADTPPRAPSGPKSTAPRIRRAQFGGHPDYDCLIGEKLWKKRSYFWDNI